MRRREGKEVRREIFPLGIVRGRGYIYSGFTKEFAMEAIKVVKMIDSADIHIKELERFIGMETEIIILPLSRKKKASVQSIMEMAGAIKLKKEPVTFQHQIRDEWER